MRWAAALGLLLLLLPLVLAIDMNCPSTAETGETIDIDVSHSGATQVRLHYQTAWHTKQGWWATWYFSESTAGDKTYWGDAYVDGAWISTGSDLCVVQVTDPAPDTPGTMTLTANPSSIEYGQSVTLSATFSDADDTKKIIIERGGITIGTKSTCNGAGTCTFSVTDTPPTSGSIRYVATGLDMNLNPTEQVRYVTVTGASIPTFTDWRASNYAPDVGESITFSYTATDAGGDLVSIKALFGDGLQQTKSCTAGSSCTKTFTHAYAAGGSYVASAVATDADENSGTSPDLTINVYSPSDADADGVPDAEDACPGTPSWDRPVVTAVGDEYRGCSCTQIVNLVPDPTRDENACTDDECSIVGGAFVATHTPMPDGSQPEGHVDGCEGTVWHAYHCDGGEVIDVATPDHPDCDGCDGQHHQGCWDNQGWWYDSCDNRETPAILTCGLGLPYCVVQGALATCVACSEPGSATGCGDANDCTTDQCTSEYTCVHTRLPDNTPCDFGFLRDDGYCYYGACEPCTHNYHCTDVPLLYCYLGRPNSCVACKKPEHCEDNNDCTTDQCTSEYTCVHTRLPDHTPCAEGFFRDSGYCYYGACEPCTANYHCTDVPLLYCYLGRPNSCVACKKPEHCEDNNECTADTCDNHACTHAPLTGDPCDFDGDGNADDGSCQGTTCLELTTFYWDGDRDLFGDPLVSTTSTMHPLGYVSNDEDCDDSAENVHPGAAELCNGIDDDCDGEIDNECDCVDGETKQCYGGPAQTVGVGPCTWGTRTCTLGVWGDECVGEVLPVEETCNLVDDDCDGTVDEGVCGCQESCPSNGTIACGTPITICTGTGLETQCAIGARCSDLAIPYCFPPASELGACVACRRNGQQAECLDGNLCLDHACEPCGPRPDPLTLPCGVTATGYACFGIAWSVTGRGCSDATVCIDDSCAACGPQPDTNTYPCGQEVHGYTCTGGTWSIVGSSCAVGSVCNSTDCVAQTVDLTPDPTTVTERAGSAFSVLFTLIPSSPTLQLRVNGWPSGTIPSGKKITYLPDNDDLGEHQMHVEAYDSTSPDHATLGAVDVPVTITCNPNDPSYGKCCSPGSTHYNHDGEYCAYTTPDSGRCDANSLCQEECLTIGKGCYQNSVTWFDSCGEWGTTVEQCTDDEVCVETGNDASCTERPDTCTQEPYYRCRANTVEFIDECGLVQTIDTCEENEECRETDDGAECHELGPCADQPGTIECDNQCIDPSTDRNNCGACDTQCENNEQCIEGVCTAIDGCLIVCDENEDCGEGFVCINAGDCTESECQSIIPIAQNETLLTDLRYGLVHITTSVRGDLYHFTAENLAPIPLQNIEITIAFDKRVAETASMLGVSGISSTIIEEDPILAFTIPTLQHRHSWSVSTYHTPGKEALNLIQIQSVTYDEPDLLANLNATQEALTIGLNSEYDGERTTFHLTLNPNKKLKGVSIPLDIPKCMAEYVDEMELSGNYKIIKDDPLIVWQFDELKEPTEITFSVPKDIDEECKAQLRALALARTIGKRMSPWLTLLLIPLLVVLLIYFQQFTQGEENHKRITKEQFAQSGRASGFTDEDIERHWRDYKRRF